MSEFLAPLNYQRARDVLRRLDAYDRYTPEGAEKVTALLKECYPMVFSRTEAKTLRNGALLLEMQGANVSDPLVFVSHMDALHCREPLLTTVGPMRVPLQRAHVVALLEALDALLQSGYQPSGELFLSLSMDGLTGGEGARSAAEDLQARQLKPCFVLDHGGYVTRAAFCRYLPQGAPLALIGITEKGQLEGSLSAAAEPDALNRNAAQPLNLLLKSGSRLGLRPRSVSLCKASEQMLTEISRRAPLPRRLMIAKPRVTFPLLAVLWRRRAIMRQFFTSELTVTGIQTVGETSRSPSAATLTFSLQTVPGRKLPVWKHRLSNRLRLDRVKFATSVENEHSTRSRTDGPAWDALGTATEILFERAVIVPCLSPYVTDARFFSAPHGDVYRFSPFLLSGDEALRGECTVDDAALQTAVQFFRQMLSV